MNREIYCFLLIILSGCLRTTAPITTSLTEPKAGHPYVAHPYSCRKCHERQYEFWATTQHSSAYLALFSKGSHFDPECISCHSLGYKEDGGFTRIAHPLRLTDSRDDPKESPFIESLMKKVFGNEISKGSLDSRLEPVRYAKIHLRYQEEVLRLERNSQIVNMYIGVQCEHCHGNRDGHPASTLYQGKVKESSCRKCHAPPNAPDFKPSMFSKISCPLIKK